MNKLFKTLAIGFVALEAFMEEPENNLFGVTNAVTRAAQWYTGEDKFHLERVGAKVLAEGLRK